MGVVRDLAASGPTHPLIHTGKVAHQPQLEALESPAPQRADRSTWEQLSILPQWASLPLPSMVLVLPPSLSDRLSHIQRALCHFLTLGQDMFSPGAALPILMGQGLQVLLASTDSFLPQDTPVDPQPT